MANFLQVTPFMHVPDLEQALEFFTKALGFETLLRMNDYAYARRWASGCCRIVVKMERRRETGVSRITSTSKMWTGCTKS